MSTRRTMTLVPMAFAAAGLLTATLLAGQTPKSPAGGMPMGDMKASGPMPMMTKAQKIANATSAAPSTISSKATVMDWPSPESPMLAMLRAGSNGWTCLPDTPETKGNDPMCVDQVWMKWIDAYLAHTKPEISRVGIGYMTAPGGGFASNSDPYAMAETADNHWGHHNPHMMILVPDLGALSGISTDPNNGGPYVMFAGTPYAHVMAPTFTPGMTMSH